ncbi:MAG: EAL domain-containing protein [Acidimicrobiales bacterium]
MATLAKETSGVTTRLILDYVRRSAGVDGVARLLELSALGHTAEELEDTGRWWSYTDKIALFDGAAIVLRDPDVAREIGRSALSANVPLALLPMLRAFGGPRQLLRNVARASKKLSTSAEMEAVEIHRTSAVVAYRLLPPHVPSTHNCAYTAGVLAQVGPIFGLPEAKVAHADCQVSGAERCTFHVSWVGDGHLRFGRSRQREALGLEAAAAIEEAQRREDTVATLLRLARSLADVTTVRETAQRLAESVADVIGSDRATVLLWDGAQHRYLTAGAAGLPTDLAFEALHLRLEAALLDEESLTSVHAPSLVTREGAGTPLASLLDHFGLSHIAVVPVRSPRGPVGLLLASWTGSLPPAADDPHLVERLNGLADQAATALENAMLLETVRRQALHDGLTSLPNQSLFADRVRLGLARARRHREELAIGVLDLDRFKSVNDSLGHACGDDLLVQVGRRLQDSVREIDTVARMGGDEFTLLLPGPDGAASADGTAARILAAFEEPFVVGGHMLRMTASLGFALFPHHGEELDDLLKRADVAMYRAKDAGRNTWTVYESGMSAHSHDRLTLGADLFRAVQDDQLLVAYQPVVQVGDGAVVGAEALVHWAHPSLGVLAPDQFMPIAEEGGLAADIDGWAIQRACHDLGRANVGRDRPAQVSVNVSGRSLTHPAFAQQVAAAISNGGIRPDQLVLEVTETFTVGDGSGVAEALADLRSQGVRVALDDFGSGHSALACLADLPVDQLKVDESFLAGIDPGHDEAPVTSAIIAMGLGLGHEVLAMGVDRPEQLAFLRTKGCHLAQGPLFGDPTVGPLEDALDAIVARQ